MSDQTQPLKRFIWQNVLQGAYHKDHIIVVAKTAEEAIEAVLDEIGEGEFEIPPEGTKLNGREPEEMDIDLPFVVVVPGDDY